MVKNLNMDFINRQVSLCPQYISEYSLNILIRNGVCAYIWVGVDFSSASEHPLSPALCLCVCSTPLPPLCQWVSGPTHGGGESYHPLLGKWQPAKVSATSLCPGFLLCKWKFRNQFYLLCVFHTEMSNSALGFMMICCLATQSADYCSSRWESSLCKMGPSSPLRGNGGTSIKLVLGSRQ